LQDFRRNGLNGAGNDLNVVNGSTFYVEDTSTSNTHGLLLSNWMINGDFTKTGNGDLQFTGSTINGVVTLSEGSSYLGDTGGNDYGSASIFNVTTGSFHLFGNANFTVGGFTGNGTISGTGWR